MYFAKAQREGSSNICVFDYKVAELEEELEAKWKSKMADALTAAKKENEKKLSEVKEEKEAIRGQAVKLKEKVVCYVQWLAFWHFWKKVTFFNCLEAVQGAGKSSFSRFIFEVELC